MLLSSSEVEWSNLTDNRNVGERLPSYQLWVYGRGFNSLKWNADFCLRNSMVTEFGSGKGLLLTSCRRT